MFILLIVGFLVVLSIVLYILQSMFFKEKGWEEKYLTASALSLSLGALCGLFGVYGFLVGLGAVAVGGIVGVACNRLNP